MHYRSRRIFAALLAAATMAVTSPAAAYMQKRHEALAKPSYSSVSKNRMEVPMPFLHWHPYKGGIESYHGNGRDTKVPYFRPHYLPYRGMPVEFEVTAYTPNDAGMSGKGITFSGKKLR